MLLRAWTIHTYRRTRRLAVPQVGHKLNGSAFCFYCLSMIHIGRLIEAELHRQERTVAWFARKLYCDRSNVYHIFKRQSIDTTLLLKISHILNYNFFLLYVDELDKTDKK